MKELDDSVPLSQWIDSHNVVGHKISHTQNNAEIEIYELID